MTTQQHPDQFDWATELLDAEGHVTLSAKEAHEIGARLRRLHAESEMRRTALLDEMQKAAQQHAENETLRAKIKAYEDIDEAASDVQLLRMGYAAARLEIESLKTQIAAHADELTVAHLDGLMRTRSVAPDPRPVVEMCAKALAEELAAWDIDPPLHHVKEAHDACESWLAAVDADRAMRAAQAAPQQDAQEPVECDCRNPYSHDECTLRAGCKINSKLSRKTPHPTQAQEPVAWYVTGCSRLLDEDEAKAEARHIGGMARAMPLYTAPKADSVLEDTARLDFLIEQRAYVVSDPDACPGYWLHFVHKETGKCWAQADEHPTPRAAIDAAMNKGGAT